MFGNPISEGFRVPSPDADKHLARGAQPCLEERQALLLCRGFTLLGLSHLRGDAELLAVPVLAPDHPRSY